MVLTLHPHLFLHLGRVMGIQSGSRLGRVDLSSQRGARAITIVPDMHGDNHTLKLKITEAENQTGHLLLRKFTDM